jgi:hypothetical protein
MTNGYTYITVAGSEDLLNGFADVDVAIEFAGDEVDLRTTISIKYQGMRSISTTPNCPFSRVPITVRSLSENRSLSTSFVRACVRLVKLLTTVTCRSQAHTCLTDYGLAV